MSIDLSPLREFITDLPQEATLVEWLWQVGVVAAGLALGWYIARALCRHVTVSPRWKFGAGNFQRVAFPMAALLLVWIGKFIVARFQSVAMLEIAESLLFAWMAIRLAVYILGHILPEGALLRTAVRVIAWAAWIAVALHVTGLLPDVVDALDSVGFSIGKDQQRITPLLVLQAIAALALTITIAMWISRITETRLMASHTVEMSTRIVMTKIVRVATLFLAVMVALPMVGIDITALSIFSGALGVGLGFGLQKIASNYVSGFIVLLDRSLRIGDVITVDNRRGEVMAIESRYTVIKGGDGVEAIIPNEKLITESVNHHTYSDPRVSIVIGVWISYESDVDAACEVLMECAKRQARVIGDPPAAARVKQLGDHGIELELTVWIADPAKGEGDLRSDLLRDVLRTFKARAVEIPYPRRDVRLIATPETGETPITSRV